MFSELWKLLTDPSHGLANRSRHGCPGSLRCVTGPSSSATEANGTRQLSDEEVSFEVGLRFAFRVAARVCLLDLR